MYPSEKTNQNDSEYNTRQRLESCTYGIQQLEALRLKHKILMEQIRRDYPSMNSLIKNLSGDESDILPQNSPSSACSLTPSHVSDDSGFAQNSGAFSEHPMDYNTFRKLSLEENQQRKSVRPSSTHIVEATLKNLTSQHLPSTSDYSYNSSTWSRLHKRRNPLNSNAVTRPKSCYGSTNQQETESTRPKSMILCEPSKNRDSKLLDSNAFAQITPPLLQRKFATSQLTSQKLEDPPQIRIKQMPTRETPVLNLKISSNRPVKVQKAELRTSKQHVPWQQSFNSHMKSIQQQSDSLKCASPVPRFPINTKTSSPTISRVAEAVKSFNSNSSTVPKIDALSVNYDKWKKNVASISPMPKQSNSYNGISDGSTTFPAARKHQMPLVGLNTISKPRGMIQANPQQIFTSSCSISLASSLRKPDHPFVRMRRQTDWHTCEKL